MRYNPTLHVPMTAISDLRSPDCWIWQHKIALDIFSARVSFEFNSPADARRATSALERLRKLGAVGRDPTRRSAVIVRSNCLVRTTDGKDHPARAEGEHVMFRHGKVLRSFSVDTKPDDVLGLLSR